MSKISYKDSGVDIEKGYEAVDKIKESAKKTFNSSVITDIGSFAGLFRLGQYKNPVLVSGTDGVGTKLLVAQKLDIHDTIGQDLVAMCVNDILCHGARPLFFLDYIAVGKLVPEKVAAIVDGISSACKQTGAALIGGETAEMPDMYSSDDYDLAGFAVGVVEEDDIIDGSRIMPGDILLGIESSGIHSNGYSLVRKLFEGYDMDDHIDELGDKLSNVLLCPTNLYVNPVLELISKVDVRGLANITGGGFFENIPRMFKNDFSAHIKRDSWPVLPVFKMMQRLSGLDETEMHSTFNMGIGMVAAMPENDAQTAIELLDSHGLRAYVIGSVEKGAKGVKLC